MTPLKKRLRRIARTLRFRLSRENARFAANFRGRGLDSLREVLGGPLVEEEIERRGADSCRVLEIGCGHGILLLELAARFPGVRLDGLNRWKTGAVSGARSLEWIARRSGHARPGTLGPAPALHFHDARKLRFPDATFDVVVSQVSLEHVAQKHRAIEETWRVLKPGGVALLNLDVTRADAPDLLQGDAPRFVVWRGERRVPLAEFFASVKDRGFDVDVWFVTSGKPGREWTRANLRLTKNRSDLLDLGLLPDKRSSFDLKVLKPKREEVSKFFWGWRSVYAVRGD